MDQAITGEDVTKAKLPHELFLINLIFNHVFLFIVTISAASLQFLVLIVPLLSVAIVGYTVWGAKRSRRNAPWFVRCHWQVAARRSLLFVAMWLVLALLGAGVFLLSGGELKPPHYAIGGITFLPIMGTMLVLILLESEAMHQAHNRALPRWMSAHCRRRAEQ